MNRFKVFADSQTRDFPILSIEKIEEINKWAVENRRRLLDKNYFGRTINASEKVQMFAELKQIHSYAMTSFLRFKHECAWTTEEWNTLLFNNNKGDVSLIRLKERTTFTVVQKLALLARLARNIANQFHYKISY